MSLDRRASSATLSPAARYPPRTSSPDALPAPHTARDTPASIHGTKLILNEGSTARDYLARERNFLSWIKLTATLAIISASLLIRFRFGHGQDEEERPRWEVDAEIPVHPCSSSPARVAAYLQRGRDAQLGILFFAACVASLVIGTHSFYSSHSAYRKRKAFVYAGRAVDALVVGIGLLTVTACVLLLAADG
ncbi:hypothetical protein JCM8547_003045 [Rhodosporidiobolus lusitaniae]